MEPENESFRVNWPFVVFMALMAASGVVMVGLAVWFLMFLRGIHL